MTLRRIRTACRARYADLAVEYLLKQVERPAEPKSRPALLLELANARLDRALAEPNENRRARQFDEARTAFEHFLRDHSESPLAPEAALDLARLAALQGKHVYGLARRGEDAASRRDLIERARPMFSEAAGKFEKAIQHVDAAIQKLGPKAGESRPTELAALQQVRLRAELEYGINRFYSALAMPDQSTTDIKARAPKSRRPSRSSRRWQRRTRTVRRAGWPGGQADVSLARSLERPLQSGARPSPLRAAAFGRYFT